MSRERGEARRWNSVVVTYDTLDRSQLLFDTVLSSNSSRAILIWNVEDELNSSKSIQHWSCESMRGGTYFQEASVAMVRAELVKVVNMKTEGTIMKERRYWICILYKTKARTT
jgi:hypothetical protein